MAEPVPERTIQDVLLDYAVYAPIGLALTAAEHLPDLTVKGRERVSVQIRNARFLGKLAAVEIQKRARRAGSTSAEPEDSQEPATTPPADDDGDRVVESTANGSNPVREQEVASPTASEAPPAADAEPKATAQGEEPSAEPPSLAEPPPSGDLAIPGYDTLAASQVVQRLSSLTAVELEEIRIYETATRGRRTILHRIAQLAAGAPGSSVRPGTPGSTGVRTTPGGRAEP